RLVTLGEVVEEVAGEEGDVAVTVAERGQPAGEHEQAVIEVAAEPAFGDGALEADAGRGDDADIDADGALAAEAADLAVLEGGEQLGLERERQFRDLVEEQRASGGLLEETAVRLLCAGEGAAGVAEELALHCILLLPRGRGPPRACSIAG